MLGKLLTEQKKTQTYLSKTVPSSEILCCLMNTDKIHQIENFTMELIFA